MPKTECAACKYQNFSATLFVETICFLGKKMMIGEIKV